MPGKMNNHENWITDRSDGELFKSDECLLCPVLFKSAHSSLTVNLKHNSYIFPNCIIIKYGLSRFVPKHCSGA